MIVWRGETYVPKDDYDRVVAALQERLRETVAFARDRGLTDEMWDEWKKEKA